MSPGGSVSGASPKIERRRDGRVAIEVPVTLETSSVPYAGLTKDVSRGGIFVATWHEVPLGREVAIEVVLPESTIAARGVVRWRREPSEDAPPGVGVAFTSLDADARDALAAFCELREPLYYEADESDADA
jgi:uncharacterized protein (TIGR02266 family)